MKGKTLTYKKDELQAEALAENNLPVSSEKLNMKISIKFVFC